MSRTLACAAVLAAVAATAMGADYSWQEPHAEVLPQGDLGWKPRPFAFEAGQSLRYIDFQAGDDTSDGTTKDEPWKHHPWDPAARGNARDAAGVDTYVFKRGVVYRGTLRVPEGTKGTPEQPIRLTSDPSWGDGEAVLCGSQRVAGWKQGADHPDIPQGEKVWHADLAFAPRRVWMVDDGEVTRLALARMPNWTVSDPDDVKSEWWTWENPQWWRDGGHKTTNDQGKKIHLGIDTQHLTGPADTYEGGIVWSEWGIVMGTPFASRIETYDPQKKAIGFQGVWYGDSGNIIRGNRYYLEDKPHYLDAPGEFWFQKKGPGGRLYLRLPGDRDPSAVHIEAARHPNLVDSTGMSHVAITGLTFRFTNVFWDLTARGFVHKDVDCACVRMLGTGRDIRVAHCRFEHVAKAVRIRAIEDTDSVDQVVVADNDIRELDHGAIEVADSSRWGKKAPPFGPLGHAEVLRNRLTRIGLRPIRSGHGHALVVNFPRTAEIAGNILHRCYGAGLFIFGGKGSGQLRDRPLSRILIHHNKVTDPLLNTNDWGGIETWQGGPFYVYCNVSGNPGGYWNWAYTPEKPASARFGHAYYLDGSFKNYHFNNIAWGKSKDPFSPLGNTAAFQEIHSYQNTFFNNTVYNFVKGTRRQAPHAGRDKFLGNVWSGIGQWLFWHARPAKSEPEGNAAHAGPQKEHFAYETNAYARNVFHDVSDQFAVFETSGRWHRSLDSLRQALAEHNALAAGVGELAEEPVLRDPAAHDFRPARGSAAIDHGVRVFVPWALHAVVGEWHFRRNRQDPTRILDEHWYMTPYHVGREDYYTRPTYPLKAVNVTADDYVAGVLEDWTEGALQLDGADQHAMIPHAELAKPFAYEVKGQRGAGGWVTVTAPRQVAVGQRFDVKLRVTGAGEGEKICAHLHWLKKAGWGGFNAWGGMAKEVEGEGPYTFTFTPEAKPGLAQFSLLIYLSPTGDWKDHTKVARVAIGKAEEAGALEMRTVAVGEGESTIRREVEGPALKNPQVHTSNFLVEVYFRTEPGHTGGGLVCKSDGERGYELVLDDGGRLTFMVRGENAASAGTRAKVNDGDWHHVVAECDREAGALRVYLDGKLAVDLGGEAVEGSLANTADFLVGRGPKGRCLAGTIEFVRVALGTLADAKTTIEELYAWQFHGPQHRDFCGHGPSGERRDAGAIERAEGP
ncbi:MAG: LamG-like jellyroll fold domain-containing protein [Candidatus Brocadiia bacterium]